MKLDFFTLYIVIVLISFALTATWASVSWQHPNFAPARHWLCGTLATTAGGVLLPFQHMTYVPVLAAALANSLTICGFWLFWTGTRRLHGVKTSIAPGMALSVFGAYVTFQFWGDPEALALAYAIGQGMPMALCLGFLTLRHRRSPGTALSVAGLAVALFGHGVVITMNLWTMAGYPNLSVFGTIATFTMLGLVFGGILWNFGLIVGSMHHLRYEVAALAELAHVDPLTGAWNRRKFDLIIEEQETKCAHGAPPFSLLMLDLDHFKAVNDRIGHAGGDHGLRHLVASAKKHMRAADQIARLGGDEFCILLPSTPASDAEALGMRIVEEVRKTPIHHRGQVVSISCSIGVASWSKPNNDFDGSVVSLADRALYSVKRAGRNGTASATA
jgi:diguanylate cyclase (GGDEF)-like protein